MPDTPDNRPGGILLPGMPALPGDAPASTGVALPTTGKDGAPLPRFDPESQGSKFREQAFQFITGRKTDGALEGDRAAQLMVAFGPSTRDPDRPDVAAAAKAMKVHPSSVRRWLAGGGISKTHEKALARRSRQAMTTKRGRAAIARKTGPLTPPKGKNGINVKGVMGMDSSLDHNYRDRGARVRTQEQDLAQLQALWVEHGDEGVEAWLHQHYDLHYTETWHFREVNKIEWDFNTNYS